MKHKKAILSVLLLSGLGMVGLLAQEALPATGGETSGDGGSASYSVGQMSYIFLEGTNGSVAQGIQQPYEISVVTALEETRGIDLRYSIYPNPATDFLMLRVESNDYKNLAYQLFDLQGKLLEFKELTGPEVRINLTNNTAATYFLKVTDHHKDLKKFKIIKR